MIEFFAALKVILDPTKNSACQGIGKYVSRSGLSLKDRCRKSDNYFFSRDCFRQERFQFKGKQHHLLLKAFLLQAEIQHLLTKFLSFIVRTMGGIKIFCPHDQTYRWNVKNMLKYNYYHVQFNNPKMKNPSDVIMEI